MKKHKDEMTREEKMSTIIISAIMAVLAFFYDLGNGTIQPLSSVNIVGAVVVVVAMFIFFHWWIYKDPSTKIAI